MKNQKEQQYQKVEQAKGRPLLQWVGKKPLEGVQFYPAQETEVYGDKSAEDFNKLFWGDNLQVLSHLLKNYRGKVDLIYIDPPFASEAEYVRRVKIRGEKIEGIQQGLLEEKQYSDIWANDEFLQFMYERILLMKELLSEKGVIYVHCDHRKEHHIRLLLDDVFGEDSYLNTILWRSQVARGAKVNAFYYAYSTHFLNIYAKNKKYPTTWHSQKKETKLTEEEAASEYRKDEGGYFHSSDPGSSGFETLKKLHKEGRLYAPFGGKVVFNEETKTVSCSNGGSVGVKYYLKKKGSKYIAERAVDNIWEDIAGLGTTPGQDTGYPTQKTEALLKRVIEASSDEKDLVADFFLGSGTTCAVAQKLGRRWIGCDINIGAIQTSTKRLGQIITDQQKEKTKNFKGSLGFKILNVNDYDVFKNELEAKEIVMEMYGIEPVKRIYFDGVLDKNFVKIMSLNRVLNKMDIRTMLKSIGDKLDSFTVKIKSKARDAVYEEGVLVVCSGMELDVMDFIKKENKTGVKIEVRDILTDKKNLIFKKKPEAKIEMKVKDKKLTVELNDFYSPILMRKLEIENEKVLKKEHKTKVNDFKQIIDSVAIDVDYNSKLFNAEVIDLPDKKEIIKAKYSWEYQKKGKYTVAIKIVDVLGEEYFETFEVNA